MSDLLPISPINDERSANIFLFGLIFNQTIKSDKAFEGPYALEQRLGSIEPEVIAQMQPEFLANVLLKKPAIHPFVSAMAKNLILSSKTLVQKYDSDARNIWRTADVDTILKQFQEFEGIGERKALVGVFLLSHHLNVLEPHPGVDGLVHRNCLGVYERYHHH